MSGQHRIETERLVLRSPVPADAARIVDYFQRNAERLAPFEPPRPDSFLTVSFWRERVVAAERAARAGSEARFVLFRREDEDGLVVGLVNLSEVVRGPFQACFLGYSLDGEAEGRGYMTEALGAVARFAFEELGLHRIMANHLPENDRSARVLERVGFVREGLARNYLFIGGRWRDHVLTALTNPAPVDPQP